MTALAQDRQTEQKYVERAKYLKAGVDILYNGAMAMVVRGTGFLLPAANTLGGVVLGVMQERVDNSGGSAGDKSGEIRAGVYKFANSGSNAVGQGDVGSVCYVEDDQTVASAAGGGRVVAGVVEEIDSDGDVWVVVGLDVATMQTLITGIETVTSGAISVLTRTTLLSVTGSQSYTLADGLYEGQRKSLKCVLAASTPVGTVTPVTLADGATLTFDAVTDSAELEWHDTGGWRLVAYTAALA